MRFLTPYFHYEDLLKVNGEEEAAARYEKWLKGPDEPIREKSSNNRY